MSSQHPSVDYRPIDRIFEIDQLLCSLKGWKFKKSLTDKLFSLKARNFDVAFKRVKLEPRAYSQLIQEIDDLYDEVIEKQDLNKLMNQIVEKNKKNESTLMVVACQNCNTDPKLSKMLHQSIQQCIED